MAKNGSNSHQDRPGLPKIYEFGQFQLDTGQHLLTHAGSVVKLKLKTLAVLECLLERSNEVVEKGRLMQQVWPNSFVEDANITVHISTLRKTFADAGDQGISIETFPRVGYRFCGDVRQVDKADAGNSSAASNGGVRDVAEPPPVIKTAATAGLRVFRGRRYIFAGLAVVSALVFGVAILAWRAGGRSAVDAQAASVSMAVIPIAATSLPLEHHYLGPGLTDNLVTSLSGIPGVRVLQIDTAALRMDGEPTKAPELAEFRFIISGSIDERFGEFVVNLRCFDRDAGSVILEKSYLQNRGDFQEVEEKIINDLIGSSVIAFPPQHWTVRTKNKDAYHSYLKGRELRVKMGNNNLRASLPYFREAYTADPDFALAYAATGDVYALLANNGGADPAVAIPLAKSAISRALALDGTLAEAWIESAGIKTMEWDWNSADNDYRRALEIRPFSVKAHRRYARFLALRGEYERAFAEIRLAQKLDPLALYLKKQEVVLLIYARRYDEALRAFTEYNSLDHAELNNFELGWIQALRGDYATAVGHFEKVIARDASDKIVDCYYAYALAMSGQKVRARSILAGLETGDLPVSPAARAFVHIGLGDNERALQLIEEAYASRDLQLIYLRAEGIYDPLHTDKRFQDVCAKVGLPQP